jgi:hypothetical protein
MERWYGGRRAELGVGLGVPGQLEEVERRLNSVLVEVSDTGTAGDVHVIRHGLGHVPRGLHVVNCVGTGAVGFYRVAGDDAWTEQELSVRFDRNNARILLEVF